jgi:hypothetical protein
MHTRAWVLSDWKKSSAYTSSKFHSSHTVVVLRGNNNQRGAIMEE